MKILEYGWACRDGAFSVEWTNPPLLQANLQFNDNRRELRLTWASGNSSERRESYLLVIRYSHVESITLPHRQSETNHSIALTLRVPPSYEIEPLRQGSFVRRTRVATFYDDFKRQAPFVSKCIRIVCYSQGDLTNFQRMSRVAGLVKLDHFDYERVERKLFSPTVLQRFDGWVAALGQKFWPVAFQCEAILRAGMLDPGELLALRESIEKAANDKGAKFAAEMLQTFRSELRMLPWYTDQSMEKVDTIEDCLTRAARATMFAHEVPPLATNDSPLHVQKVTITPTTMKISGPEPEQSNRVLRKFAANIEAFVRVTFADNDEYSYHFDREVDVPGFVKHAVGNPLRTGIVIAGRRFEFLAYSSSALKEHSVWFVTTFCDSKGKWHSAKSIRDDLGNFEKEKFCKCAPIR